MIRFETMAELVKLAEEKAVPLSEIVIRSEAENTQQSRVAVLAIMGEQWQVMKEAIESVAHDRTLVIVAHRLSTVIDADQIVVLDGGRVVGIGTHSALLASTPLYRELAEHQLLA